MSKVRPALQVSSQLMLCMLHPLPTFPTLHSLLLPLYELKPASQLSVRLKNTILFTNCFFFHLFFGTFSSFFRYFVKERHVHKHARVYTVYYLSVSIWALTQVWKSVFEREMCHCRSHMLSYMHAHVICFQGNDNAHTGTHRAHCTEHEHDSYTPTVNWSTFLQRCPLKGTMEDVANSWWQTKNLWSRLCYEVSNLLRKT